MAHKQRKVSEVKPKDSKSLPQTPSKRYTGREWYNMLTHELVRQNGDVVEVGYLRGSNVLDAAITIADDRQLECRHRNIWLIAGGYMCWCYECGAVRPNTAGDKKHPIRWQKPSYTKENPAMKKWYPALTWSQK